MTDEPDTGFGEIACIKPRRSLKLLRVIVHGFLQAAA